MGVTSAFRATARSVTPVADGTSQAPLRSLRQGGPSVTGGRERRANTSLSGSPARPALLKVRHTIVLGWRNKSELGFQIGLTVATADRGGRDRVAGARRGLCAVSVADHHRRARGAVVRRIDAFGRVGDGRRRVGCTTPPPSLVMPLRERYRVLSGGEFGLSAALAAAFVRGLESLGGRCDVRVARRVGEGFADRRASSSGIVRFTYGIRSRRSWPMLGAWPNFAPFLARPNLPPPIQAAMVAYRGASRCSGAREPPCSGGLGDRADLARRAGRRSRRTLRQRDAPRTTTARGAGSTSTRQIIRVPRLRRSRGGRRYSTGMAPGSRTVCRCGPVRKGATSSWSAGRPMSSTGIAHTHSRLSPRLRSRVERSFLSERRLDRRHAGGYRRTHDGQRADPATSSFARLGRTDGSWSAKPIRKPAPDRETGPRPSESEDATRGKAKPGEVYRALLRSEWEIASDVSP